MPGPYIRKVWADIPPNLMIILSHPLLKRNAFTNSPQVLCKNFKFFSAIYGILASEQEGDGFP